MSKQTDEDSRYPAEINDRSCAKALYDNLQEVMGTLAPEEFIKTVLQIDEIFKTVSKKPDWQHNNDVRNQIDQSIDDILYDLEKQFNLHFENPTEVIATTRSIGINNYAG